MCLYSLSGFTWNVEEDFKTVPETWIPAHRVKHHNGQPVPDEHGHIPGSGLLPTESNNDNEVVSVKKKKDFTADVLLQIKLVRIHGIVDLSTLITVYQLVAYK